VGFIILYNPNRFIGQYLSKVNVKQTSKAAKNCLVCPDQDYINFMDGTCPSPEPFKHGNIIICPVTRGFSLAAPQCHIATCGISQLRKPYSILTDTGASSHAG
jgi:hypothetical protein